MLSALAALMLSVAVLAGCAPSPSPAAAPPADTPAPTQTPTAEPVRPVIAFDGDCANMLSSDQLQSLLGDGAVDSATWDQQNQLNPETPLVPEPAYVAAAGGLECTWRAMSGIVEVKSITVLAIPVEAVPEGIDYSTPQCEQSYDVQECVASGTVESTWLMARQMVGVEPPEDFAAPLVAALDAAAMNLASYPSPVPAERTADWWELAACEDLGARMGLAELFGEEYHGGVPDGSMATPGTRFLESAGLGLRCPWFAFNDVEMYHDFVLLELAPGAAGQWERLTTHPSAKAVDVEGATAAMSVSTTPDLPRLVVTDGVNILIATAYNPGEDPELLRQLAVRALGALTA